MAEQNVGNPNVMNRIDGAEIQRISDRLMVVVGKVLLEEIETAEAEGINMLAWQFGALDALTKQVAGAVTACVTMLRQLSLSPEHFVIFRQRVFKQLHPAVLAVLNVELAKAGSGKQGHIPWPGSDERTGHA